jgi:hypothetical protein
MMILPPGLSITTCSDAAASAAASAATSSAAASAASTDFSTHKLELEQEEQQRLDDGDRALQRLKMKRKTDTAEQVRDMVDQVVAKVARCGACSDAKIACFLADSRDALRGCLPMMQKRYMIDKVTLVDLDFKMLLLKYEMEQSKGTIVKMCDTLKELDTWYLR